MSQLKVYCRYFVQSFSHIQALNKCIIRPEYLSLVSVPKLHCKFGLISHKSGDSRPGGGTGVITEGLAGKSSDTHSLADSAAVWTGHWPIGWLLRWRAMRRPKKKNVEECLLCD